MSQPKSEFGELDHRTIYGQAVAHSSDINGVSGAVNTVALKDIDVQMSALSGYETYV